MKPKIRLMSYFALFVMAHAGLSFGQTAGKYMIQSDSSRIEIHVYKSGFLSAFGDDHLIVLRQISGTAEGNPVNGWRVRVVGQAASLEVLDPKLSASTRAEIRETMLGPSQMDVKKYTTVQFAANSSAVGSGDTLTLVGDLTVHGVTRHVEVPINWKEEGNTLRVTGRENLRLKDFNIEPIRKSLGAVKVRNEFDFEFDISLSRSADSSSKHNSCDPEKPHETISKVPARAEFRRMM